jgi:hypothetical protein
MNRTHVLPLLTCLLGVFLSSFSAVAKEGAFPNNIVLLPRAHAHNDYRHARPLRDALDHGFRSVEADIFLVDSELRVGHDRHELKAGHRRQKLYLEPPRQRVSDGVLSPQQATFYLWIDVKADGEKVYNELRRVLPRYGAMLSSFDNGKLQRRTVTVVLSGALAGSRSGQMVQARGDAVRYAFIDGRLTDLESSAPALNSPLVFISDSYRLHFKWHSAGQMPLDERSRLHDMVVKAHAQGLWFHLWATPDTPEMWGELLDAGADLINTDDLPGLRRLLLERIPMAAQKFN